MKKFTYLLTAAILTALSAHSVGAATVQFSINLVGAQDPSYTATTSNLGLVTYDESALTGSGDETLKFDDATVSLRFDDQWYTGADDALYPDFPEFYFTDGELMGLSLEVTLTSATAGPTSYLLLDNNNVFYSFDGTQEFNASMSMGASSVPEPSSSLLIIAGLCGLMVRRSRVASNPSHTNGIG
ncbi:MAG: PEP-CTERM sorting domain-containing protein [Akkermansiaceae bacterium]